MDKGPFRGKAPENKQQLSAEPAVEPQQVERKIEEEMPRVGYSRMSLAKEQPPSKAGKPFIVPLVIICVVIVIGLVAFAVWSALRSSAVGIDNSKYQVVSLSDGQVYFGSLSAADSDYMKLTNVYYLQPLASKTDDDASDTDDLKDTTSTENNFKLVKFTDIVYGPENEMIISRDQIVHYDNLNPEGKVAKAIEQYKGK